MDREILTTDDLNPFVRYAQIQYTHWRSSGVFRGQDWRLFYCFSGTVSVRIERDDYILKKAMMLLIPPGLHYRMLPSEELPGSMIGVITFDLTAWNTATLDPQEPIGEEEREKIIPFGPIIPPFQDVIFLEEAGEYQPSVHNIIRLFLLRETGFRQFASAALKTVLLSIAIQKEKNENYSIPVRSAIQFIDLNFRAVRYPREVADAVGYSTAHLSRLMKAETGRTLGNFILYFRLFIAAKRLLDHPEGSVGMVGIACGFSSASSFGVFFKKQYGISPLEYRKRGTFSP